MTSCLRFLLGDQLSLELSALKDIDPAADVVVLAEMVNETIYVPHHQQKITLFLSAMRHFAADLRARGVSVDYVRLDDPENSGNLAGELDRMLTKYRPQRVVMTEPGEWRLWQVLQDWRSAIPLEIRDDERFFCSRAQFSAWADGRKTTRMEYFYRDMRRASFLLMEGGEPIGGRWNFDQENRKGLPAGHRPPRRRRFAPDGVTREVMALVGARFAHHFGALENFDWAVTRADALDALEDFITLCLPDFGDFQDAMQSGEPFLYHAVLSPYLNLGLLGAREVCAAAEAAYKAGRVPLNAAEGFIRQILGWREYVRGLYWLTMPGYAQGNALAATRRLPEFYWTGETALNCVRQVISDTRRFAYSHHIQRLMVTGNFALLAGIAPAEVEAWYLAVYADAVEWVELPNTHGMALFADGGLLASKPYAASGAYIDRMSDYCAACRYDPTIKLGPGACPFNLLYWHFIGEQRGRLANNPRMAMPFRLWDKKSPADQAQIHREARAFLESL
jgi:deoxyribodipyrimidine photolyase-related protein